MSNLTDEQIGKLMAIKALLGFVVGLLAATILMLGFVVGQRS